MLIQIRHPGLRLIRQHDHGLLSGELAAAWAGPLGSGASERVVVLATALHDLGWRELDEVPRWNAETGRPLDFLDFPPERKYRAASDGINRVGELHPYAAVLVSLHYTSFGSPGRPSEFEEAEADRRVELLASMGDDAPGPRQIQADLQALRLFDNLSLFLCLTTPAADPSSTPSWLTADLLRLPSWAGAVEANSPGAEAGSDDRGGAPMELAWRDEENVTLDPFLFEDEALELDVPYRDLPKATYESTEVLERAWRDATEGRWKIRLTRSGGGKGSTGG